MTDAHGAHDLIEALAALVLTVGGGLLLVLGAVERRRSPGATGAPPSVSPSGPPARRLAIAALSGGAGLIHLAAAGEHVEALGDLGLGFYAAGLGQLAVALAAIAGAGRIRDRVATVLTVSLLLVWAWSRTIGWPLLPAPESVAVADGVTVGLELGLLVLLVRRPRRVSTVLHARRWPGPVRSLVRSGSLATASLVTVVGLVFLGTTLAVRDVAAGHAHGPADGGHGLQPDPHGTVHGTVHATDTGPDEP